MAYGDISFTMAAPFYRGGYALLRPIMWLASKQREFAALQRIPTLHFAAFAVVDRVYQPSGWKKTLTRPYMIFLSLFDGSAEAYLADFAALVPDYIDSIWGKCMEYPGSRDFDRFLHWLGRQALVPAPPLEKAPNDAQPVATRYEFHGYRVDAESGGLPETGGDRQLAPMELIAKSMELRRRLRDLYKRTNGGTAPETRELLQRLAAEML